MTNLAIYGCIDPKDSKIIQVHNLLSKEDDMERSFLFFAAEYLLENYQIKIEQQLFDFLEKKAPEMEGTSVVPDTGDVYKIEYEITNQSFYLNVYEKITRPGYLYNTYKFVKIRVFFLTKNEIPEDFQEIEIVSDTPPFSTETVKQEIKTADPVDGFMEELTEKLKVVRIKNDIDLHISGFTTRKRKRKRRYD